MNIYNVYMMYMYIVYLPCFMHMVSLDGYMLVFIKSLRALGTNVKYRPDHGLIDLYHLIFFGLVLCIHHTSLNEC